MAKFHFTMKDKGYSREADYEIPDELLKPPKHMIFEKRFENPNELLKYRNNIINQHLQRWALAYVYPTWREIPDESQQGNADRIDQPPSQ